MISEEVIQKIKDENDIVDVVSESVKLKRTGRNYMGLCPFHNEKSPSFSVSQDKQIYKCFGCGEAGNVFTFVMKSKNMSFVDAVKYLGEKVNIEIEDDSKKNIEYRSKNERVYKVNVEAAKYYFNNLQNNKAVMEYFTGRGITRRTVRSFGLGYAKEGWQNLMNYLKTKGYTELDLLNAGLIIKGKNNSYYDRFRNRVIFPVFNYTGKVIGFGGRVLDDSKPKYLNSPETGVFKKGTNLYGLNFAIKNNKDRTMIIVEGYMDCISLHQYGITNAVASLGTALTPEQAKLLKRYADKVIVAYDADLAGQSATIRGLKILKQQGFDLRVLSIPEGKDPDEFIGNNGREAFLKLIDNALPIIDYELKAAERGLDLKDENMLIEYIDRACEIISELPPIEKDVYIRKLSEETGVKEQAFYDQISREINRNVNKLEKTYTKSSFGPKLYLEPAYVKAERSILRMMFENIDNKCEFIFDNIKEEDLVLDSHKKIFYLIKNCIEENEEDIEKSIELKCDDIESSKEWINIRQTEIAYCDNYKEFIDDCMREIRKFKLEESKKDIMKKIKHYEKQGLFEESLKLIKELERIQKDIMQMNNNEGR